MGGNVHKWLGLGAPSIQLCHYMQACHSIELNERKLFFIAVKECQQDFKILIKWKQMSLALRCVEELARESRMFCQAKAVGCQKETSVETPSCPREGERREREREREERERWTLVFVQRYRFQQNHIFACNCNAFAWVLRQDYGRVGSQSWYLYDFPRITKIISVLCSRYPLLVLCPFWFANDCTNVARFDFLMFLNIHQWFLPTIFWKKRVFAKFEVIGPKSRSGRNVALCISTVADEKTTADAFCRLQEDFQANLGQRNVVKNRSTKAPLRHSVSVFSEHDQLDLFWQTKNRTLQLLFGLVSFTKSGFETLLIFGLGYFALWAKKVTKNHKTSAKKKKRIT